MNYFVFVAASSIEYFGVFILMFALFRFKIYPNMVNMVLLVAFLMSQVSYITRLNPEIGGLSSYIQLVLFILVLWILFRVPLFYSVIMNFAGMAVATVTQVLCIFVIAELTGITTVQMQGHIWIASALQVLTAVIEIGIARTIFVKNWGFDFVPTSPRTDVKIRGTNALLLAIITVAIVLSAMFAYLFRYNFTDYVLYASIIFVITLPLFLYYSMRKDKEDAA